MADSAFAGAKRKKPPTFQHYPINRAKALKKAWVEKTKIKSKWKAEKRKENLASTSKLEIPVYSDEEESNNAKNARNQEDRSRNVDEEAPSRSTTSRMEPAQPHLHPSRAHIHPDLPVKRTKSIQPDPEPRPAKRQRVSKEREEAEVAEPASLRDLTREAYSRSTLHTYKADPMKKRRSASAPERGGKSGHRGREEAGTGRGQPNMKLRMNAMLAKIKQDFA